MSPSALRSALMNAPVLALLCAVSLAGPSCTSCKKPDGGGAQQPPEAAKDAAVAAAPKTDGAGGQAGQWYRAWVVGAADVGDVPFFLRLPARPERGAAIVANGPQRIEAEARWYGAEVSVNHPLLRTRMFLRQDDAGALKGHMMTRSPVADGTASLSLQAVPVPEPDEARRFPDAASCRAPGDGSGEATGQTTDKTTDKMTGKSAGEATDKTTGKSAGEAIDAAAGAASDQATGEPWGEWLASLESAGAVELILEQASPGVVKGSFTFGDGTVAVLFGNAFGNRMCLSSFDGVNSFLALLEIEPGGKALHGRFIAGPALERRFAVTAEKRDQVEVVSNSILFTPNRTKVSLFELGLPQYRGKPLIIEFGASWCPPCLDSAPVLRSLYEQHHGEGLEIVTLLFELLDDEDALRRQARLFVDTHAIPWQVIPVRGEIKPYWDIIPHDPDVAVVNLPVTVFVNADGTIRDAHTGFPGPESGQLHQAMVERYQRVARELVAKKP
jgi:thiol-disulfide isomerase/thioredoxin